MSGIEIQKVPVVKVQKTVKLNELPAGFKRTETLHLSIPVVVEIQLESNQKDGFEERREFLKRLRDEDDGARAGAAQDEHESPAKLLRDFGITSSPEEVCGNTSAPEAAAPGNGDGVAAAAEPVLAGEVVAAAAETAASEAADVVIELSVASRELPAPPVLEPEPEPRASEESPEEEEPATQPAFEGELEALGMSMRVSGFILVQDSHKPHEVRSPAVPESQF